MPAIVFDNASIAYGDAEVVRGLDLEVTSGETHVLLGESGSGKTTILRAIAGFEPLASGTLSLYGERVDGGGKKRVPPERRGVGVVFQDYALFPHLDVAGNLAFGQKKRDDRRIDELLEAVGLTDYRRRQVAELSGGEQQRVALARALAQAPKIILFDEPFSNLNRSLRRSLRRQTLSVLADQNITAVFVTHDREEAFAIADTLSVIDAGQLLATGKPLALLSDPVRAEVAQALGDCAVISGKRSGDTVECCLGAVTVRGEGERVVVRPTDIELTGGGEIEALIVYSELAGSSLRLTLEIDGDELIATTNANGPREGTVRLSVAAAVFPAVQ